MEGEKTNFTLEAVVTYLVGLTGGNIDLTLSPRDKVPKASFMTSFVSAAVPVKGAAGGAGYTASFPKKVK